VVATQRHLTRLEWAMAAGVDVNTQQSFEALNQRAVAVVVDPIQSVKGKVVIDAFRSINPQMTMMGYEPRQTTSIIGHLNKPSIQALIHGLNRHYYSIAISYRKSELEEKMLMNLHKKGWTEGLKTADFKQHDKQNEETVKRMLDLAKAYNKAVQEEDEKTAEKFQIDQVSVSRLLSSLPSSSVSGSCPKSFRGARMFPAQPHTACFGIRCSRCHCSQY
jgi:26S proteasome regulatory subunit N11